MDELVLTRTLKEELMSVFSEEAQIMADLDACEKELEEAGADMDKMQVPSSKDRVPSSKDRVPSSKDRVCSLTIDHDILCHCARALL